MEYMIGFAAGVCAGFAMAFAYAIYVMHDAEDPM